MEKAAKAEFDISGWDAELVPTEGVGGGAKGENPYGMGPYGLPPRRRMAVIRLPEVACVVVRAVPPCWIKEPPLPLIRCSHPLRKEGSRLSIG